MKRGLYILGISLSLASVLWANQNTADEEIIETNTQETDEPVLELDEYNADYSIANDSAIDLSQHIDELLLGEEPFERF